MKPSKLTIKSVDGSPDTVYVQLDKVKELIERKLERYRGAPNKGAARLCCEELLEQLEGLE